MVGFELEEEGFLAKILVPLDAKAIAVGKPIAVIVDSKEDITKASAIHVAAPAAAPTAAPAAAPVVAAAPHPPTPAAPAPVPADHSPDVYTGVIEKYGPAVRMLLQLYG